MSIELPNLAGVATADLVERIGTGKFSASYINWARTVQLLREHAPGWQPELVPAADGALLHSAPVGAYLLIRFRNGDQITPVVPQAIMDNRNAPIAMDCITARDVTDTHRRGVCMAAAFTFGLAYELWAKLPLESGYAEPEPPAPVELAQIVIDGIRDAAMQGTEALQRAFKNNSKTPGFADWWKAHSADLKAAAAQADQPEASHAAT